METYKHTPGPWIAESRPTKYPDLLVWGVVQAYRHEGESHRYGIVGGIDDEANARLIAAAPELLAALIAALPYVECAEDDPAYKSGAVAKMVRQMRAAIAKAEGQ